MKIFITGNRGQIGSHIEAALTAQGHTVVGFDKADGHNILNYDAVRSRAAGCHAVIHLASLLGRPADDPNEIMELSVMGSWHVLQAAEAERMQRVVYFSSVNALGIFMGQKAPDYLPIDDEHPARPQSPYGLSKRLVEEMCGHFTQRTGIATICLRPPAVWMPESYARIRAWWQKEPEAEWRHAWEYGAFCDVRDVAAAAVLGLTCRDPGHVTILLCADEIGSDTPSRQMAQKVHSSAPWVGGPEFETEPYRALVSNHRAKEVLGWQPQYRWQQT